MNKSSKKLISLLMALVLAVGLLSAGTVAFGNDTVEINAQNFPDETFRQVVKEYYDTNGNNVLDADERSDSFIPVAGMIDTSTQTIKDLKGIEYFTNAKNLRCGGIGLESLDVSALTGLTALSCQGNRLTSLDLSSNTNLVTLNCSDNKLESITLPADSNITMLHCYANSLTSIDTSRIARVTDFRCDQNDLSSIDMSYLTALTDFNCSKNHLTSLDLSQTALTEATDYMIGGQTLTLEAEVRGSEIAIPFTNHGLNGDNYRGCSLDKYEDGSGFEFNQFTVFDVNNMADGIEYWCYPMFEGAENMTVKITVERSFYQVDFYTDSSMTDSLGRAFVNAGEAASAPEATDIPLCKAFDRWSDDITAVSSDLSVYPIWKDSHAFEAVSLADDGDTVTVKCPNCAESYTVSFISIVNSKEGETAFDPYVDAVADGYINAKDYSYIAKITKK